MCCCKVAFRDAEYSHSPHLNGFNFLCTAMTCLQTFVFVATFKSHSSHSNGRNLR